MIDRQRDVRRRPAWQPLPVEVEWRVLEGPSGAGGGLAAALQDFYTLVLPYPLGSLHARFWGWAAGTDSPTGMLAAGLA